MGLTRRILLLATLLPAAAGCLDTGGGSPGFREPILPGAYGAPTTDRYLRTGPNVVCDQRTETCYKGGAIDKTETQAVFGNRAAREADRLRDRAGTGYIYVPRNAGNSYCVNAEQVCYKNGRPDWSDTRDVYGKKAAQRLR